MSQASAPAGLSDRVDERELTANFEVGNTSGAARASTTLFNPEIVFKLQHHAEPASTRSSRSTPIWSTTRAKRMARCVVCSSSVPFVLQPRWTIEPASETSRFSTGGDEAARFPPAHETLAIAMNRPVPVKRRRRRHAGRFDRDPHRIGARRHYR